MAAGALREGGLRPKRRSRSNDATASSCAQDGASSGEGDGPARGWIRKGLPLVHQDQQRRSAPRLEQYTPPCHPPVVARGNSDDRAARPSSHIFGVTPPCLRDPSGRRDRSGHEGFPLPACPVDILGILLPLIHKSPPRPRRLAHEPFPLERMLRHSRGARQEELAGLIHNLFHTCGQSKWALCGRFGFCGNCFKA